MLQPGLLSIKRWLTFMATISILCQREELVSYDPELRLPESASRWFFAFPHVVRWIETVLPTVDPLLDEGRQDAQEQLDFLLYEYTRGADIAHYETAHVMVPHEPGIFELKTPDLRIFGWFNAECSFIAANIDTAVRCKDHGLYAGYRDDCVRRRDRLDLNPPKFINGDIRYVLCT